MLIAMNLFVADKNSEGQNVSHRIKRDSVMVVYLT